MNYKIVNIGAEGNHDTILAFVPGELFFPEQPFSIMIPLESLPSRHTSHLTTLLRRILLVEQNNQLLQEKNSLN